MTAATHLSAGLAVGFSYSILTSAPIGTAACVIMASGLGSLLPDIDTATSKLGRKIAPVSFLISLIFGHRQMFHSMTFWLIPTVVLLICGVFPVIPVLAGMAGIASHILLDAFNPSGVPLIWPSSKRLTLARFRVRGLVDRLLTLAFLIADIALIVSYNNHH